MKHISFLLVLLFSASLLYSQEQIAYQGFEESQSNNWSHTISPESFTDGYDIWDKVESLSSITPKSGSYFWGLQDLDSGHGITTDNPGTIDLSAVDVSGYENVVLTFDYYTIGFDSDNGDILEYSVSYDNGSDWNNYVELNPNTNNWTTVTINVPAGSSYVRLRFSSYQNGGSDYAGIDHIQLEGDLINSNLDKDSQVTAPQTQVEGSTIDAETTTAIEVLKFIVSDLATSDSEPTLVNGIKILAAPQNSSPFTSAISSAIIEDESGSSFGSVTISDNSLFFTNESGYSIDDSGSEEFTMKVVLKAGSVTDGGMMQFMIDADNHGFTARTNKSRFATEFAADIVSNVFTTDVIAKNIIVNSSALTVEKNKAFFIESKAVDNNGNVDIDFSELATLSQTGGNGTVSFGSSVSSQFTNGTVNWSNNTYNSEDEFTVKVSTSSFNNSVTVGVVTIDPLIPAGYYDGTEDLSGSALKTALYNIINGHDDWGYGGLYSIYEESDNLEIDGVDYVFDMYSVRADSSADYRYIQGQNKCGSYALEGDCYNREHLFPQSWFNSSSPMKNDAFHVIPSDGKVNGQRSSYPFGEVGTSTWTSTNGSKRGNCVSPGYSSTVFEPIDEYKGDIARSMLYMATRYETQIDGWSGNGTAGAVLNGTEYPCYKSWFINLLLNWSAQDPVSTKETIRNNAVYDAQENRNPFIDHPEWVNTIWGTPTLTEIVKDEYVEVYPNPSSGLINIKVEDSRSRVVNVFTATGIKVKTMYFNGIQTTIDLSSCAKGLYFVKVDDLVKTVVLN